MKRLLCALTALLLLFSCASASVRIGFEDGFSLELPDGWLHYEPSADMLEQGVLYCLSDAEASRWLHIQCWNSDCADSEELKELILSTSKPHSAALYNFGGTDFVVYDLSQGDTSCSAAIIGGRVYNFVFNPQSDSEFMAQAAQILASFELSK